MTRTSRNLIFNPDYAGAHTYAQIQTHSGLGLKFATNGNNDRLTISSGGLATFSDGIQFGTGATLDAYEEGTFTPTDNGDATGGLGATIGEYTRVGNVVHFRLTCTINANFTSNGVGGLPYTIGGATSPSSVVGTIVVMQGSVNYMFGLMGATTSRIEFFSDNKFTSLPPTTAMGTLRMSGSYRTN